MGSPREPDSANTQRQKQASFVNNVGTFQSSKLQLRIGSETKAASLPKEGLKAYSEVVGSLCESLMKGTTWPELPCFLAGWGWISDESRAVLTLFCAFI